MWNVNGKNISMAEGDFGVALPGNLIGTTLSAADTIRFTFKSQMNGSAILVKEYTPVHNLVTREFTAEESALFPVGSYVLSVDWYQNGVFMNNIIPASIFKVVDKA